VYHFFVEQEQIGQKEIVITGEDVNHIRNVLRMKPGEEVLISNGQGINYCCEVTEIAKEKVIAQILSENEEQRELPAKLYLFQGLPKGEKMELIIQKAVELGVYQIIPVSTRRSVVKLEGKKEEAKIRRWNSIAESAAKQSGRGIIPKVTGVMSLKEAFSYAKEFDRRIIPFEHAKGMFKTKRELEQIKPKMEVGIFIGPEGGFEDEEITLAQEAGVAPISLGKRILRTETAGLMVLSVTGYLLELQEETSHRNGRNESGYGSIF